jgi:cyclophilin family peptidyl-prolyl cis-trans isomerase
MALLVKTVWGDLVIDLDNAASPELCLNFLKLAKACFLPIR